MEGNGRMNVLDQITLKQSPWLFSYQPQEIVMQEREIRTLPALISELVGMSIVEVNPIEKVGRVMVFEVTPYKTIDPPLIYCNSVNLEDYYFLWGQTVNRNSTFYGSKLLVAYELMMKSMNLSKLQTDEASFLIMEMLKFKNEYVRRS